MSSKITDIKLVIPTQTNLCANLLFQKKKHILNKAMNIGTDTEGQEYDEEQERLDDYY